MLEDRAGQVVPSGQCLLGESDAVGVQIGDADGESEGLAVEDVVVDATSHESGALRLHEVERRRRQQVVLGPGHTDQQAPGERGVDAAGEVDRTWRP